MHVLRLRPEQEDQSNKTYDIAAESKGSGNEEDSGEIFSV